MYEPAPDSPVSNQSLAAHMQSLGFEPIRASLPDYCRCLVALYGTQVAGLRYHLAALEPILAAPLFRKVEDVIEIGALLDGFRAESERLQRLMLDLTPPTSPPAGFCETLHPELAAMRLAMAELKRRTLALKYELIRNGLAELQAVAKLCGVSDDPVAASAIKERRRDLEEIGRQLFGLTESTDRAH